MMKIGIEAQRIFRAKKHGMDFVAINYIIALAKEFPNNTYWVFAKKGPDTATLPQLPNIKICYIPGLPYPVWEQILLPLYCKLNGINLLHCTSNTAPIFPGCKLVLTLHDIIFLESNPLKEGSSYQKFGNLYRKWVVPPVVKKSETVITVSHYEKENILKALPKSVGKTEVVYNAANAHFENLPSKETSQKIKKKYGLPEKYFLFLGNTDPKKNVSNVFLGFMGLWKQLPDQCPYLVVPDYPASWLNKWFSENDAPKAFQEKIHCSGYIQNSDLQSILIESEAFLYPSKRESFGIPILEGYWSMVPVITSNAAAMPEVAGNAAILIDPLNPQTITDALNKVLNFTEEEKIAQCKLGMDRAKTFTWSNSAKQLNAIYNNI